MRRVDDNDDADRFRLSVHVEPRALADLFSTLPFEGPKGTYGRYLRL